MVKLYRAIEFSNLQFLLDEDQYIFWIDKDLSFNNANSMNWWLERNTKAATDRRKVVSTIAKNPNEVFFNKSAEFNSVFGGRFNPPKSFGGIYCANSPFVASLEVLYHYFVSSMKMLKPISKNKSAYQTLLNSRFKNKIEMIVVAFEFESDSDEDFYGLNNCKDSLSKLCGSLGFSRYLTTGAFDRNFIFGNDYEISRILGCHLHSQECRGFKVPSARLDFEIQDLHSLRNYFIPEKDIADLNLSLTGRFKEYRYSFTVELNDEGHFDINLETNNGGAPIQADFQLEPFPNKKYDPRKQIITYEHDVAIEAKRSMREVHTQKFFRNN